jgi:hypothetical protein
VLVVVVMVEEKLGKVLYIDRHRRERERERVVLL